MTTLRGHFVKAHTKAHTMGHEKGDPKAARFSCVLPLQGSNLDSSDPESVPAPGDDSAPRRLGVVSPPPDPLAGQYPHTKAHTMEGAENCAARAAGLGGPVLQYTTEGARALRPFGTAWALVRLLVACVPIVLVCLVTGEGLARADDAMEGA